MASSPPEVAALLSSVVYEGRERVPLSGRDAHRADDGSGTSCCGASGGRCDAPRTSTRCSSAASSTQGFATPICHWAEGQPLEEVLAETEMAPGDFIRNCKQLLDLMRQIEDVGASRDRGSRARGARDQVLRGVVAYTGV